MKKYLTLVLMLACTLSMTVPSLAAADAGIVKQTSPSGIEYVSGGIGDARQEGMEALRKDFSLRLTFARPKSGDYVVDVKVTIENSKHEKVLDVVSGGPMLFANLPGGKYTVTADAEGHPQTKTATISKGHPRGLVFYFAKPK